MFRKKRTPKDFAEEIQAHLDLEAEDLLEQGLSEAEARRRARLEFGNVRAVQEQYYLKNRVAWLDRLGRDLRYGLRGLWRNPGFTIASVVTLAIAIGANAGIFSLLDQALMQTLPVVDPSQLVVLSFAGPNPGHHHGYGGNEPGHIHEFSYGMYRDLRDRNTVFSGLIAAAPATVGISWNNHAEAAQAEMVSGNYFETLGVRPASGRLFLASDETVEGADPVAVVSFEYWKTHLGEAAVAGKTLLINGTPFTITGVAAPGFHSMVWGRQPAVYVPMTMQRVVSPDWAYLNERLSIWIDLVGRLRPGVTATQAEASLNPLFHALREGDSKLIDDQSAAARKWFVDRSHINVESGAKGFSPMRDDVRLPLTIVMGMVLLVICMATVNVAGLLLVRAAARAREFSVRYTLGATSWQILRQLMAEGLLLGAAGAGIGLLLAPEGMRLLIRWMSGRSPGEPAFSATLDWRVLAFTAGTTLAASLLFSLAPALQFWNPQLADSLKQQVGTGAGGALRFRRTAVALQIGFSLLLMVAAGLFVRTIQNLRNVDPGFVTDSVLEFNLAPEMAGYRAAQVAPVEQRALDAIAALPGIRAVGATNDADLDNNNIGGDVLVPGYTPAPHEDLDIELPMVSDGYLQTLGVPLLAGRYFNASDTSTSQKVAVVNETFARHYFGSASAALGRHVSRPKRPATDAEIVGVVRDVKHTTLRDPVMPTDYTLFAQGERPTELTYYVRTWQAPESTANSVRVAIAQIDSKLVVSDVSTLQGAIEENLLAERTIALLATVFGGMAALLAGIGLYGILAYSTAQRTREIGIRMALGARRSTVIRLIVREVLLLAGGAIAVTVPLAMLGTRLVRSVLFGVSIADPRVYGVGIAAICAVAALAGFVPARRAATVNPVEALRTE